MFDSFFEQFSTAIEKGQRSMSSENLNLFFFSSRQFYSTIESNIKQDTTALKYLIRMIALVPINKENMIIGSNEAARMFASATLNILLEQLNPVWTTIIDTEWSSFREGHY
jgi:hypothetical protein